MQVHAVAFLRFYLLSTFRQDCSVSKHKDWHCRKSLDSPVNLQVNCQCQRQWYVHDVMQLALRSIALPMSHLTASDSVQDLPLQQHPGKSQKGTEQNGTERNRIEQNGTEQNRTEWNRTEWNGTEQNGTEQNGTERNGTEQNGTERSRTEPQ